VTQKSLFPYTSVWMTQSVVLAGYEGVDVRKGAIIELQINYHMLCEMY